MLEVVRADMMDIGKDLIDISMAIGGIGALLYISYRVWQSLARNEPIDVFPLLRPFAIGICILTFNTLVIGSIDGILNPLVDGTNQMVDSQNYNKKILQKKKDQLRAGYSGIRYGYEFIEDEEMESELEEIPWYSHAGKQITYTLKAVANDSLLEATLRKIMRWLFDLFFKTATIGIDCLRTFFLIILTILGPIAFAISIYDGFQNSLIQWLSKYISVFLWLPICNIFTALINRLEIMALQKEMDIMYDYGFYVFNSSGLIYLIFLIIGTIGIFMIPTVSTWIVQTGGMGNYTRGMNLATLFVGNRIAANLGGYSGRAAGHTVNSSRPKLDNSRQRRQPNNRGRNSQT